jgi:hypothetical protein
VEEARQHSAVALRRTSLGLYFASYGAFLLGIIGQLVFGGSGFKPVSQLGPCSDPSLGFLPFLRQPN